MELIDIDYLVVVSGVSILFDTREKALRIFCDAINKENYQ